MGFVFRIGVTKVLLFPRALRFFDPKRFVAKKKGLGAYASNPPAGFLLGLRV